MKLIDSDALLKQLGISERFNNADIPAYVIGIIKGMPSAEPQIIWCKDCSFDRDCTHTMTRKSRGGGIIYCPVEYCSEAERKDNG